MGYKPYIPIWRLSYVLPTSYAFVMTPRLAIEAADAATIENPYLALSIHFDTRYPIARKTILYIEGCPGLAVEATESSSGCHP